MKTLRKANGYSLLELLIAGLIAGVIATTGFKFYVVMHNQALVQEAVSDTQQNSRACIQELSRSLQTAGYRTPVLYNLGKCGDRSTYEILTTYYNGKPPRDTIQYFLQSYKIGESEYETLERSIPDPTKWPMKLMKKHNSDSASIFADHIQSLQFQVKQNGSVLDSSKVSIILMVMASRPDPTYTTNYGYRTYMAEEMVFVRNQALRGKGQSTTSTPPGK
ncbi:MAG: hypothetical protein NTV06_08940 [candidate division Zixibacteria bacterium]|nr:hypothetical protein [candidate division Zixibacteria bacterium]